MNKFMEKEIWKDIVGYEGLYQVSNFGRVKGLPITTCFSSRIKKHKERILTPSIGKRGYYVVVLSKKGKAKTFMLHRIIAKAFIPNEENLPQIDHIDTNKLNNSINNLRWCTAKGNCSNPLTRKHISDATKRNWINGCFLNRNNLHYIKVAQYTKDGNFVKIWNSIIEASNELKIDSSSISAVCRGTNKHRLTAGGYVWKHVGKYYLNK